MIGKIAFEACCEALKTLGEKNSPQGGARLCLFDSHGG
jgi:hypothetical protein